MNQDHGADLIGTFTAANTDVGPLHIRNTIYLPTHFFGLFFEQDITPAEAWTCLHSAIVNGGQEVDYQPIIDWICIALTKNVGDDKSPLAMPQPTATLNERVIYRHHMLTRPLTGLDPTFQRVKGLLITTHIGDVSVELR